jgi:aquaporin Z
MKKFIVELTGTFFIVLTMLLVVGPMAGLAGSGMVIAMMFAVGKVSGGQFNPAISLAMFIQGKMIRDELPIYFVAQVAGMILAAMIGGVLASCNTPAIAYTLLTPNAVCGILCEFLGAFALVLVYLTTQADTKDTGKLAVGVAILALTATFGSISGGFFNPALAAAGAISGTITWANMLMFAVCHFLGAAAATTVVRVLGNDE